MSTFISPANSRAMTTFWRFPPDRFAACTSGPGALMSKSTIAFSAFSRIFRSRRNGPNELSRYERSSRFIASERLGETPVPSRSSGT